MPSLVKEQADWSSLKQTRRRGAVGGVSWWVAWSVPDPDGLVDGYAQGARSELTSLITLRSALMSSARDVCSWAGR